MLFSGRNDAGRQLGEQLLALKETDPVVLALPRGGVPVGFEIARILGAPLRVPAGKQEQNASTAERPCFSWPSRALTRCITWE